MKFFINTIASRFHLAAIISIFLYFLAILLLALWHHWGYLSSLNDLGIFDQVIWGTLHGKWFLNTINPFASPINWLGYHFNPILLLFCPLYALFPSPVWLIIAQAFSISIAAWPIFLLATYIFKSSKTGFLWAASYLLNPFVLNAAIWDFHPVTLVVPFLALGMLALEKNDKKLLLISCIAMLLTTEHFGLSVAGFGVLWWVKNKNWKFSFCLIALGLCHTFLVLNVFMPFLSPSGAPVMMSKGMGQLSRYNWLGSSSSAIISTVILHPLNILKTTLFTMGGMKYLEILTLPFLGLAWMTPAYLLPGVSDFAANILSANPMPRSVIAYHSITLIPIIIISSVYGVLKFSRFINRYSVFGISCLILSINLVLSYQLASFIPTSRTTWSPTNFIALPDKALRDVMSVVKSEDSVSAQANIGAYFSQRLEIYRYPIKKEVVDKIVLRLDSPTTRFSPPDPGAIATLAHHIQMPPSDYLSSIQCLLLNNDYHILLWKDPWLVLAHGPENNTHFEGIERKLNQLRFKWKINLNDYRKSLEKCSSVN